MERIKNALEKARSNQGLPPGIDIQNRSRRDQLITGKTSISKASLKDLEYTDTRVVQLDPLLLEKNRIVSSNKHNHHSNIFDLLRTQVLSKMKENGWKTLAVVSPTPSAGKSVIAINLAMSIAQFEERSAMLVDFDLRRPSIARYLGLEPSMCINDLLDGNCEMKDALVNPSNPRLVVLPAHRSIPNSAEMLASTKVRDLINEVRDRYAERVIVIDLPPILNTDDALAVIPHVDCLLLVVASGLSTQKDIEETRRYLGSANLVGTVFNKTHTKNSAAYGY